MTPHLESIACTCGKLCCGIPYGLCHCGCGQKAPLSASSNRNLGLIRGRPSRYIKGHNGAGWRPDLSGAMPFKIEGVYCRLVAVGKGLFTIVDASDYDAVIAAYRWYVLSRNGKTDFYVTAQTARQKGVRRQRIYLHRFLLGMEEGYARIGDHKDVYNTLDNRRKNLRIVTPSQSQMNRRKPAHNTVGLKGVTECDDKTPFKAAIKVNGHSIHLGSYDEPQKAHAAYCGGVKKYHGEYGRED